MTDGEFERFHAETAGPLHAYLARVGGGAALADDLVQSAYLRFLGARRRPEDPRARRVYLFRIARNLLRDEFRRQAKERGQSTRFEAEGAPGGGVGRRGVESEGEAPGLTCESRIDVRRAFEALSPRDRELLWLAYVVGLSHREIAEVAHVGESSVRVLLYRARSRFSDILDGRGIGPEDLA
jgi:RNA polymerase sigma-70 factor (ECF subfamily)